MIVDRLGFHHVLKQLCVASLNSQELANKPLPCRELMAALQFSGQDLVETLTQSPGANEYRLNGDQLKLKYDVEFYRDAEDLNVYVVSMRIEGDQASAYPEFLRAAEAILSPNSTDLSNSTRRAA